MTYDPRTDRYSQPAGRTKPRPQQQPQSPSSNPFVDDAAPDEPSAPDTYKEYLEPDKYGWIDVVSGEVVKSLKRWGEAQGYSPAIMGEIYSKHAATMFQDLQNWGFGNYADPADRKWTNRMGYLKNTPDGLNEMIDWALNWWGRVGIPLQRTTGGSGSGRGRGRSGPTAQDIRNQFDIKELANMVNEMNRELVFEDHKNAMGLAREYVDAIVATKGEKKIDFATFVEDRISNSARFKTIYRNKPEHLSAREYMAPYIGAARSVAAPEQADDIAIGGAQLGTSPEGFRQRLQREDTVTGSAPFIQGLEQRLNTLNSVFKG